MTKKKLTVRRSERTIVIVANRFDLSPVCSIECESQLVARQMQEWLSKCELQLSDWIEDLLLDYEL